jgi:hypothetical protein
LRKMRLSFRSDIVPWPGDDCRNDGKSGEGTGLCATEESGAGRPYTPAPDGY